MRSRLFAFACLSVVAACSNPNAQKAQREDNKVAAAPAPVEQSNVTNAKAAAATPDDIGTFIVRREQCDHFRGEEGYDEERRRFLAKNLESTCKGTDAELAELKRKYASRDDLTKRLSEFESTIE